MGWGIVSREREKERQSDGKTARERDREGKRKRDKFFLFACTRTSCNLIYFFQLQQTELAN